MSKNKIEIEAHIATHALEILREDITRILTFLNHEKDPNEQKMLKARLKADEDDVAALVESLKTSLHKKRVAAKALKSKQNAIQSRVMTAVNGPISHSALSAAAPAENNKENVSSQGASLLLKSAASSDKVKDVGSKPKK